MKDNPDIIEVRHLIGGQWIDSDDSDTTLNPFHGTPVGRVGRGTLATMDKALEAARKAAPQIAAIPAHERAAILHRAAALITERAEEIGLTMSRETGKAIGDAVAEVSRSQDTMTLSAEEAVRIEGSHVPLDASAMGSGKLAFMTRFPVGVVAAVTPFNAPFNLACHKIGPAFAAGNACVLKPPPQAAATVHKLAEIFQDAGAPAGALNVVHGGVEVGKALVSDPRVDFVTFTGSSAAGAAIKAASGLRRVALELGGAGQTIVHSDADVAKAAPLAAKNAMRLAGQSCLSVQTVFVHNSRLANFTDLLVTEVAKLRIGDPQDPATDVGTLIDDAAAKRVENWIGEAAAGGAEVLIGGIRHGAAIEPTVIRGPAPTDKVFCEEVFGPVVSVVGYDDIEAVFDMMNAGRYGLHTGIFTASNEVMMRAYRAIRTGGLIVNGTSTWRTDQLAYGGVKDSGIGREGPRYAIRDMTDERMILFNM